MNEIFEMAKTALKAADDKKAFDIKLLDISKISSMSDYFLICSGNSDRQVKSIADEIDEKMKKAGFDHKSVEGYRLGRWILMDYIDVVVHIFHKEDRDFYGLDKVWHEANSMDVDKLL